MRRFSKGESFLKELSTTPFISDFNAVDLVSVAVTRIAQEETVKGSEKTTLLNYAHSIDVPQDRNYACFGLY